MPVRLARAPDTGHDGPPARWTCGLVNNMPDGAFEATERQFLDLVDAGSQGRTVEVTLCTMDGIPRGERAAARIAGRYHPVGTLRQNPPDLLIVTGANPLEPVIEDEPYWDELSGLLTWGVDHVPTMLLSCLSAHAGLAVFDGIVRTTLDTKCTGVFPQRPHPTHPLASGLGTEVVLPHSRLNTVPTEGVRAAGYSVVLDSEAVGWSVVTRTHGGCEVVLVQGHPEYDPSSLLREYQRDARRYVLGERDAPPCLPVDCVAPGDRARLGELHRRIVGGEREPALVDSFPFGEMGERAGWPWREAAVQLYTNWMAGVTDRTERNG